MRAQCPGGKHQHREPGEPAEIGREAEEVHARCEGPEPTMDGCAIAEGRDRADGTEHEQHILDHRSLAKDGGQREWKHQRAHVSVRHGSIGAQALHIRASGEGEEQGDQRARGDGIDLGGVIGKTATSCEFGPDFPPGMKDTRTDQCCADHGCGAPEDQLPCSDRSLSSPMLESLNNEEREQNVAADDREGVVPASEQQSLEQCHLRCIAPARFAEKADRCIFFQKSITFLEDMGS